MHKYPSWIEVCRIRVSAGNSLNNDKLWVCVLQSSMFTIPSMTVQSLFNNGITVDPANALKIDIDLQ